MMMDRVLVGGSCQAKVDAEQMADWVNWLGPWDVIAHLTFRWEVSLDAARRGYERFMRRALPEVSYFYAEEANPARDGYHVHALWGDARTVYRKEAWATWFKRFGRARIEPVRDHGDVSRYCAKYVTKEGAWWNLKLQWHRSQAQRGESFKLERDVEVDRDTRLPVPQKEFRFAADVFNLASDPPTDAPSISSAASVDPRQGCLWRRRPDGVFEICPG